MARTETIEYTARKCPCTQGVIVWLCETSENHGYGGADQSFKLRCDKCAETWKVNGSFLEHASRKSIHLKKPKLRPFG